MKFQAWNLPDRIFSRTCLRRSFKLAANCPVSSGPLVLPLMIEILALLTASTPACATWWLTRFHCFPTMVRNLIDTKERKSSDTLSSKFQAPSPTPNDWDPCTAYRFYSGLCHVVIDEVSLAFPRWCKISWTQRNARALTISSELLR
jgi:hypothetical protein